MSRGTRNLFTLWMPFEEITPEIGSLVACLGSHRWQKVIDTYDQDDVDRDQIPGILSTGTAEPVDGFGGRPATTFQPGDAMILSTHDLHGSHINFSDRYRISCDTRCQLADEPVDERWAGEEPLCHPVLWSEKPRLETVEAFRRK